MRSINQFIVRIDNKFKDEIEVGGQKIYLDPKFNEFEHRVCSAEIVSVPEKHDTGAAVGDTLYFHHRVIMDKKPISSLENYYMVSYDKDTPLMSESVAYKSKETNELNVLSGWALLLKKEEKSPEEETTDSGVIKVSFEKKPVDHGVLMYAPDDIESIGVSIGDKVFFNHKIGYTMNIDGVEYLRMRPEDFLYAQA